jgi:hypothetical protein
LGCSVVIWAWLTVAQAIVGVIIQRWLWTGPCEGLWFLRLVVCGGFFGAGDFSGWLRKKILTG